MDFAAIDKMLDEFKYEAAYALLKESYDEGCRDTELLHRLGRACYGLSSEVDAKNPKKKDWIMEGRGYTESAILQIGDNGTDLNVLKWAAVLSGSASDFLGIKDKIQQGYAFKELLDRALALDPNDFILLHMRGRFSYSVANLSWIERKTASALFATPPTATIDDALTDFLAAYRVNPDWIENLMYIGKCYLNKGDKNEARRRLAKASELKPIEPSHELMQVEVRSLLAKYK